MGHVDPYLLHAFDSADERSARLAAERRQESFRQPTVLPMLLRIISDTWDPNGMKLTLECWLDQQLTPCLPGCAHEREALGSPFLDAWLH